MPEFRIPAVDMRLGDEVELHEGDPMEPLLWLPHHKTNFWVVAELHEGGRQPIERDRMVTMEDTLIAVCVRKVTPEDLELNADQWRLMKIRMGLSDEATSFQITQRHRFIKSHIVRVRRPESAAAAEELRRQVEA